MQTLVSLPPRMAAFANSELGSVVRRHLDDNGRHDLFVGGDPPARRLGSAGGTVHLLHQAWLASGAQDARSDFGQWLRRDQRLILHAAGESRRLPAYATVGKILTPVPVIPGRPVQRFDQMLCDLQLPGYRQTLAEAGPRAAVMLASGDVMLDFDPLQVPAVQADICGLGMRVSPEVAQHFGVFFIPREGREPGPERRLAKFLQKPRPDEIRALAETHDFLVDTGMWLFSAEAVEFLFALCGWRDEGPGFATDDGFAGAREFYSEVCLHLGADAKAPEAYRQAGFGDLTSSIVPLDAAQFHHLGSNRQLLEFMQAVQAPHVSRRDQFCLATPPTALAVDSGRQVWLDSVLSDEPIRLRGANLLTCLPPDAALSEVPEEICLDLAPLDAERYCFRPYHLDDPLRGAAGHGGLICGRPARAWLDARGLGTEPEADVFDLPLYPVLAPGEITQDWLDWFLAEAPEAEANEAWLARERYSARQILESADPGAVFCLRLAGLAGVLQESFQELGGTDELSRFGQDFGVLAEFIGEIVPETAEFLRERQRALAKQVRSPVWRTRFDLFLAELQQGKAAQKLRDRAFQTLRQALVHNRDVQPVRPRLSLKSDQIAWARSPVRLDLAGGWTDTPPYCLEFGGAVLNVAVMLNGQPPIQVIARPTDTRDLRLRSIDLGESEIIRDYAQLLDFQDLRSPFSLPRAALAIAGFHPDFHAGTAPPRLGKLLADFGGGLELSLLCAVPKGSGLGTSSILAATLLGALNRCCGLEWDQLDIFHRVLAVEQLLGTGGGWQDQAGALYRGIKLVQTEPGLHQNPTVRYLPEHLLAENDGRYLLYYTGLTRLAKNILQDIVRDMFLGRHESLATLDLIHRNAHQAYHALLVGDRELLARSIDRSWQLNQRLDPDTTNDQIAAILQAGGDDLAAAKLLGAGGGGFLFICARNPEAGRRLRQRLEARPPNPRARFLDFSIAESGLQVTVS